MADGLSGGGGSGPDGAGVPGHLSLLLQELARAPADDLHRAWQQRLQPGDAVGRFEILRELGRGGFGVVYEALDRQLGRSVAFKTLRPARTGHELSADWILKEAEAVARLDHPAIVTLYDVGRCDSGPYLVEELLRGETLEQRLHSGPLPAREAVAVGLELARGLAHAHGRGVLHRDLKPGNVFLTEDGRVKLLDFGLAHLLGTRGLPGAGTPAYMAPEQLRGEAVDARADVFALGATLFETLAGKAPFQMKEGRSAALDEGPSPALPKGMPKPFATLVERCLSRDPARRPASGQAVMEELLAVQRAFEASVGAPARRRSLRLALALAGVAFIVVGGVYLVARRGRSATETNAPATPALPSVAVLPFADLSPGKDQDYFADGIAEEILGALSRVGGLRVPGRSSSFWFKGKNVDPAEIARKLGVTHLLEGSVRRSGTKLRITAEVVKASSGDRVWSETYERDLTDVFAIQDEIARSVVRELAPMLLARTAPPPPAATTDPEAYRLFLLGLALFAQETPESIRRALEALERSAALDPRFAPTQATLAAVRGFAQQGARGEEFRRLGKAGREAADRAVALDPSSPLAYVSRAWYRMRQDQDWKGAYEDLDRAMAIDPANEYVLNIRAILLSALGRTRESVEVQRRAVDQSPLNVILVANLAMGLAVDGQYAEAREWALRSLEISPGNRRAAHALGYVALFTGKAQVALTEFERSFEPVRSAGIVAALHSLGREQESRSALAQMERNSADEPVFIAGARAWRGDHDGAFEALDRAVQERNDRLWTVKTFPLLRPIRGDPRFAALLKKMNLPVD